MAQVFTSQARGTKTGRANLHEEAARVNASRLVRVYEAHEFDIAGAISTAKSIRDGAFLNHATSCSCARASGAFGLIGRAQRLTVRNVGQDAGSAGRVVLQVVSILGTTTVDTNIDKVTLDAGEFMDWNMSEIEDIFFTTPGVATRVRITLH